MTQHERKQLKARAHALKPVVIIGAKGLTDAVLAEIDVAISHHELIKVKIAGQDKPQRLAVNENIASTLNAALIQTIGQVSVFYRKTP